MMKISMLVPQPLELQQQAVKENTDKTRDGLPFARLLQQQFEQVNQLQKHSDEMTQNLLIGQVENFHDVTIAAEQAQLALQLTVQIRNKLVEAYQEISRMQI